MPGNREQKKGRGSNTDIIHGMCTLNSYLSNDFPPLPRVPGGICGSGRNALPPNCTYYKQTRYSGGVRQTVRWAGCEGDMPMHPCNVH